MRGGSAKVDAIAGWRFSSDSERQTFRTHAKSREVLATAAAARSPN